jgi:hypothetical protein
VIEAGVAVIVSVLDSGAFTVRPAETLPLTLPLMPWTVIVTDPVGVVAEVLTVNVVLAVPPEVRVTDDGLKFADAALGRPLAASDTDPANPPVDVTVTV